MRKYSLITALISISLISVELVWTRIFSAEYFYTFAFLILSIAVLGMGLGGLALRLFGFLNSEKAASWSMVAASAFILISPLIVIRMELDFTQIFSSWLMLGKITGAVLLLGSSFFLGGISISWIFRNNHGEISKIYMADLIGAGLGIFLVIILMNAVSVPAAAFISAVPLLLAAFIMQKGFVKLAPALLMGAAAVMSFYSVELLNNGKEERAPVVYTHWDAMSKIKVYVYDSLYYGINIDNAANSPVYAFDGNWDRPDSMKYGFSIDVSNLIARFDSCSFLSLGAGGGTDVLQALQAGASDVYAVEVNPHINEMMVSGYLADFSGNIYNDPRVSVVTEDARAYIRRHNEKFDVIYSLSSNTFAALASGSFALAENYLFTKEAFIDYWNALSPGGFMMMEHQFYMPRLTAEYIEAMEELGVKDYLNHFAVYDLPHMRRNILLVSKQPLTDEIKNSAFGEATPQDRHYKYLLYPPAHDTLKNNLVNLVVQKGWEAASDSAKVDISPSTDDKPFTAQLGLWKNFSLAGLKDVKPYDFFGFPLSKIIMAVIMGVILLFVVPLNLIPYFKKDFRLKRAPWLYFFAIGMAFMSVEVILIQKYALYIGPSIYSIVTILLTLLAGSGLGSRFSGKVPAKYAFGAITVWLLLEVTFFPALLGYLTGLEIFGRMLVSAALIFPLGFFMGMPFPKATERVKELVDWGFAVNGAASVLGSVFIVYFAFSFGFSASLLLAAALYLGAYGLYRKQAAW